MLAFGFALVVVVVVVALFVAAVSCAVPTKVQVKPVKPPLFSGWCCVVGSYRVSGSCAAWSGIPFPNAEYECLLDGC